MITPNPNYSSVVDILPQELYADVASGIDGTITLPIRTIMTEKISCLSDGADGVYVLRHPVMFYIEVDSDGFYYRNSEYGIVSGGRTQKEARENILSELKAVYDIYAMELDEKLDEGAKMLKERLIELIGDDYASQSKDS